MPVKRVLGVAAVRDRRLRRNHGIEQRERQGYAGAAEQGPAGKVFPGCEHRSLFLAACQFGGENESAAWSRDCGIKFQMGRAGDNEFKERFTVTVLRLLRGLLE